MRRTRPLLVILTILTGCAVPSSPGWHPQSKEEMRMLIGETVFMALDQYEAYLRIIGEQTLKDSLEGQDDADKPTH